MVKLKDFEKSEERFTQGHRTCQGCAIPIIVRHALRATEKPVVIAAATGCLEVCSTIYPYTSWKVPWIHSAFENAASTISGVEAAFKSLKRQRKAKGDIKFIAFGGDGGTYDIGLQALSGALERGHDFTYICYDNEAYMNTGVQRSSATPYGAMTTTTPVGEARPIGKEKKRKELFDIIAAHKVPYAAQASISNWPDLYRKAKKAIETKGPTFLNILSPCVPGWKYDPSLTVHLAKKSVSTGFWPLYEYEEGEWTMNFAPKKLEPIEKFLEPQGRFKHLFKPKKNKVAIKEIQKIVDDRFEYVKKLSE